MSHVLFEWGEREESMFQIGQLVIYGSEGVCRVENIGEPGIYRAERGRLYYTLRPLNRTGQVMTPVDTAVLMRPVMEPQQADELIAALPELEPARIPAGGPRVTKEFCRDLLLGCDCRCLVGLIKALRAKRTAALRRGKQLNQMEESFLRRAEDALYGELGAALGLEREELTQRMRRSDPDWPVNKA